MAKQCFDNGENTGNNTMKKIALETPTPGQNQLESDHTDVHMLRRGGG